MPAPARWAASAPRGDPPARAWGGCGRTFREAALSRSTHVNFTTTPKSGALTFNKHVCVCVVGCLPKKVSMIRCTTYVEFAFLFWKIGFDLHACSNADSIFHDLTFSLRRMLAGVRWQDSKPQYFTWLYVSLCTKDRRSNIYARCESKIDREVIPG